MGILSGLGCDHQRVVALDLQLAAVAYGIVAQVGPVNELPILARLCALQPDRMNPGVAHQPWSLVTFQPGMLLELLPVPGRDRGIDGDPFGRIVAGAEKPPVLAAPG